MNLLERGGNVSQLFIIEEKIRHQSYLKERVNAKRKKIIDGLEWGYNKKNKKVHFINLRVLF